MGFIVHCVLLLYLFIISTYQLTPTKDSETSSSDNEHCFMRNSTIGSTMFNRSELCKHLTLNCVTFTETSPELFDTLADGLYSLNIFEGSVDTVYLPHNLIAFRYAGWPGFPTKITIDDRAEFPLKEISLTFLPQLPDNLDKLRSLKDIHFGSVYRGSFDFTVLSSLKQLENIFIFEISRVEVFDSLELPSLRQLTITNGLMMFSSDAFCRFPNLEMLALDTTGLAEIPEHFSGFTNLTNFSVVRNRFQLVNMDVFAKMDKLFNLELSENHISELTTQNKIQLPRLKTLTLTNNNLSQLDVTLWIMPALEYLSLRNNRLKQVMGLPTLFTGTVHQYIVELVVNPLDCGWLQQLLANQSGAETCDVTSLFALKFN